jgi:ornithine cyclodeaminase/alanine dehydrogenase-like protein (mu-crystallin family)
MLVLNRSDVRDLLDVDALIDALAEGFVALSAGRGNAPPRGAAFTADGLLGAMAAHVPGALGAKLVAFFHGNPERGLLAHEALVALFDEETGTPLALMDGTELTAVRTAAGAALAARVLARRDARVLAVIGAGETGRESARIVSRVRDFEEIRIWNRTAERAAAVAAQVGGAVADSVAEAVAAADVICVCTDSPEPILRSEWVAPGAHVSSTGGTRGGGELDRALLENSLLVVESRVAFQPMPAGAPDLEGLDQESAAELGEVIAGTRPGRTDASQRTVYKSMGHAIEDAVAARLVYDAAVAAGRGRQIDLSA